MFLETFKKVTHLQTNEVDMENNKDENATSNYISENSNKIFHPYTDKNSASL